MIIGENRLVRLCKKSCQYLADFSLSALFLGPVYFPPLHDQSVSLNNIDLAEGTIKRPK